MIMKNLTMLLFLLCMGASLCVIACSQDQAIQVIATVELVLASFAFIYTVYKINK
jgi:hypothetical protein